MRLALTEVIRNLDAAAGSEAGPNRGNWNLNVPDEGKTCSYVMTSASGRRVSGECLV